MKNDFPPQCKSLIVSISPKIEIAEAASFKYENAAANGCDSIVHLNLTINDPVEFTDNQITCEPFTWIDGVTYNQSNNSAIFNYENGAANGCDSIVYLNLTINDPVEFTDNQITCEPFTWIDGVTYNQSNNSAIFNYENGAANGCDSIVYLNLSINDPVEFTDNQTTCEPFTWIDGVTYNQSNNTASFKFENAAANGCDSLVHLNLSITKIDVSIAMSSNTLTVEHEFDSYLWLNCNENYSQVPDESSQSFKPTSAGDYAVVVTKNSCMDTSTCFTLLESELNTNAQAFDYVFFPNPTHDQFFIKLNNSKSSYSVKVLSISGALIESKNFQNTELLELNIATSSSGIYLVEVVDENDKQIRFKILKK